MTRYGVNRKPLSPIPPRKAKGGDNETSDSQTEDSDNAGIDEPDCTPRSFNELERSPSGIEFNRNYSREKSQEQKQPSPKNRSNSLTVTQSRGYQNSDYSTHSEYKPATKTSNIVYFVLAIVIPFVCWILYIVGYRNTTTNSGFALSDFKREILKIGEDYKINSDNILQIQKGIETTFKNEDTASILFLYRGTDKNIVDEFVNRVADVSAKFLRNETDDASPIIVKKSDLNMDSDKELLHKYGDDLKKQGIVTFSNLEDIPAKLAMAFHYYCDEYDPLAKKTAVFFTLDLAKCKINEVKTKHEEAERCMMEKWQTLGKKRLMPLLTRVVNIVVDLEGQLS